LATINPKYAKYLNNNASKERGNYFAIVKNLTEALAKEWFWNLRTDKKYSKEWIEAFLNDLMASEWGETIAQEWKVKSKRLKLECKITGTLIDAGVLEGKGTDNTWAEGNRRIWIELSVSDIPAVGSVPGGVNLSLIDLT
jgi:hypothetical protein